jgi:hypothetical protein
VPAAILTVLGTEMRRGAEKRCPKRRCRPRGPQVEAFLRKAASIANCSSTCVPHRSRGPVFDRGGRCRSRLGGHAGLVERIVQAVVEAVDASGVGDCVLRPYTGDLDAGRLPASARCRRGGDLRNVRQGLGAVLVSPGRGGGRPNRLRHADVTTLLIRGDGVPGVVNLSTPEFDAYARCTFAELQALGTTGVDLGMGPGYAPDRLPADGMPKSDRVSDPRGRGEGFALLEAALDLGVISSPLRRHPPLATPWSASAASAVSTFRDRRRSSRATMPRSASSRTTTRSRTGREQTKKRRPPAPRR